VTSNPHGGDFLRSFSLKLPLNSIIRRSPGTQVVCSVAGLPRSGDGFIKVQLLDSPNRFKVWRLR